MTTKAEDAKHRAQLDVARGKAIKAERDEAKLKVGDRVPRPVAKVKDDWHIRPRVITVASVEAELPFDGCICCGALLSGDQSLKHRASCLYLAYRRADDLAFKMHLRVEQLEDAMKDIQSSIRDGMRRR